MLKLSHKEECFLKHWMFDELHYTDNSLPRVAKRLQRERGAKPAELAEIIAAWMPDTKEQWRAAESMPEGVPEWPWESEEGFRSRLAEARAVLGLRREQSGTNGAQAKPGAAARM
jgi:hypothetical protein